MSWTSLRDTLLQFFDQWQRLAFVAFILVGTLVATLAVHFLVRRFHGRPRTGESVWRDAILGALTAPLQAIVWLIGLSVAENVLTTRGAMPLLSEMFPPVRDVAAIVITVWFVIRLTRRAAANLRSHALTRGNEFDETAADAIGKFVIATIVIVAALAMMQTLGFSIASLLTFGGVTGIVLGFAAQGLVSNLLGGITIYASRPFKVGDHIILPDVAPTSGYAGWQAGEVQHIGWRATRILDWNGKPFYVPNAKFNTETIVNHSRMAHREISEFVCVRLQDIDKISGIVADVNRMLEEHPEMGDYLVFRFDSFGDYALKLYLYAYTAKTITAYTDYTRVKQDVLLKIAEIVVRSGARLAVPVASVYLPDGLREGKEVEGVRRR